MMHQKILTTSILAIILLSAPCVYGKVLPQDTIVAVVNNDAITYKEFQQYLSALYVQLVSEGRSATEIRGIMAKLEKEGLSRLIEDRLLIAEADKREVTIRDFVIDEKLKETKKKFASEDEFMRAIIKEGLTISDLRKKIADQIKAKYIIDNEVKAKVYIHPNEVTEFYKNNSEKFLKPERAELDSIFIPYEAANNSLNSIGDDLKLRGDTAVDSGGEKSGKINGIMEQLSSNPLANFPLFRGAEPPTTPSNNPIRLADEKASEVIRAFKAGGDFGELSKTYSSMPSVGIVERGQLVPEIENVVFNLKEGGISEPIKVESGIFIFRLKQKLPPTTATLDEAKDAIYDMLYAQKFQKRFVTLIDDLKKKAYIEIKD